MQGTQAQTGEPARLSLQGWGLTTRQDVRKLFDPYTKQHAICFTWRSYMDLQILRTLGRHVGTILSLISTSTLPHVYFLFPDCSYLGNTNHEIVAYSCVLEISRDIHA